MNVGRTVFAQLLDHLPSYEFQKCVTRYRGDYQQKAFSCWDHYLAMAFAQLTYRDSLRDIEACLRSMQGKVLAALLYGASGVMKVFMFDKVSEGVPSFGALPREAWKALGILELVCTVGLIVPAALHWQPALTVVAAAVLSL